MKRNQSPLGTAQSESQPEEQPLDAETGSVQRNLRNPTDKQMHVLEEVAPAQRPSRKSTRRSANRTKSATQKTRQTKRKLHAPKSRALRNSRKAGRMK